MPAVMSSSLLPDDDDDAHDLKEANVVKVVVDAVEADTLDEDVTRRISDERPTAC